jgi:glycosyltransferase involved in cell wall biosynthesis
MFEHAQLEKERPFGNRWHMPWQDFNPAVASEVYRYFLDRVSPDVVIAHFAINAHRFYQRIAPLGLSFPVVVMTHGIDVFNLKTPSDYTDYVVQNLARRKDVAFTAVSRYLRRALVSAGVPVNKVTLCPNTVNPRFFEHRKISGFWDGSRPLELLCVGRLIKLKAHDKLIDAVAKARKTCNLRLTIVYGNGDERLDVIRQQIARLGLTEQVRLLPFVDFRADPNFFAQFDLYVHPSTYSDDHLHRSETFGVAVLEAIAAGLPVIATDAGGLPEVIGKDGPHARVVRHGDVDALAIAIVEMATTPESFTDNRAYAQARLALFSPERQRAVLAKLLDKVVAKPCQVAIFSTSTIQGAGYAAFRLHRGLRDTSISPHMFTTVRNHEGEPDVTVVRHPSGNNGNWSARQFVPKAGLTIFSVDETHIPTTRLLEMVAPYDVINVHWHARFLSIDNVGALTHSGKPVVMTVRDMQPITGGCHFFHGCTRWKGDCRGCPQLPDGHGETAAAALAAKRAGYNFDNLTLVALSNHTRGILEQTPYFRNCRIETIPNSIETDIFRPHDKSEARAELGLPQDRKIIGYVPSFSSEVKGYKEILAAFVAIEGRIPSGDPLVMLVGNETPATQEIRFDKKSLGYINDNRQLARAYCAADVIVVPSLEETFSNTTAEAISCGVPVVGFKTGAIPDLVVDGKTGFTSHVGDVDGLARGIVDVLTGPDMGLACRIQALQTLSFQIQAFRYEALFTELVNAARCRHAAAPAFLPGRPSGGQKLPSGRDNTGTDSLIASTF